MTKYLLILGVWTGLLSFSVQAGDNWYAVPELGAWRAYVLNKCGANVNADGYANGVVPVWGPKNREWIKHPGQTAGSAFLVRFHNYMFDMRIQINGTPGEVRISNLPYSPFVLWWDDHCDTAIYGFYDKNYLYLAELSFRACSSSQLIGIALTEAEALQKINAHQAQYNVRRGFVYGSYHNSAFKTIPNGKGQLSSSIVNVAYSTRSHPFTSSADAEQFLSGVEFVKRTGVTKIESSNIPFVSKFLKSEDSYTPEWPGYSITKRTVLTQGNLVIGHGKTGSFSQIVSGNLGEVYEVRVDSTPPPRIADNSMGTLETVVYDEALPSSIAYRGVTSIYKIKLSSLSKDNHFYIPGWVKRLGEDSDSFIFYYLNNNNVSLTTNAPSGSMRVQTTNAAGKINAVAQK